MITGVRPAPDYLGGSPRSSGPPFPFPSSYFHASCSYCSSYSHFLSAFSPALSAGPFVSGSAYVLFIRLSLLLYPLHFFFFFFLCGLLWSWLKKFNWTLCIVVFGLFLASFSSPSCLIGISRLRHNSPRGRRVPPRSRLPQLILSLGVVPHLAIDSDLEILSWANGRLRPKIKKSSRLLLGSAWVGRMGAGQPSGPRSSRRARDLIVYPCTSDVDFF